MAASDWYQNEKYVTISLKLNSIINKDLVTARFDKNYCVVLEEEKVVWKCSLASPIVPDQCRIRPAGKRIELKLRKEIMSQWNDLEDKFHDHTEAFYNQTHTNELTENEEVPPEENNNEMDADNDCNNSSDDDEFHTPPATSPRTSVSHDLSCDLLSADTVKINSFEDTPLQSYHLKHIPHDMLEKDNNKIISLKIMISQVGHCLVTFNKHSIVVHFKTHNNRFLDSYPGSSSTTLFSWDAHLYEAIIPDSSSYKVTDRYIELVLTKVDANIRWRTFESSIRKAPLIITDKTTPLDTPTPLMNADHQTNPWINNLDLNEENSSPNVTTITNFELNPFMLNKTQTKPIVEQSQALNNLSNTPSDIEPDIASTDTNALTSSVQKKVTFYRLSSDLFTEPCLTGLSNLGNTCFMSSIVQCLSNTPEVRDYFLGGKYRKDLNAVNPLGYQGKLADCFHTILDKLWSGKYRYFPPRNLKELVATKSDQFTGYGQQDAHEFTTFLLDGLHEDLNRITDKPTTFAIESNGRPDAQVAEESWLTYMKRNDSFIVDLFGGQFKSTLVCPECNKESVTFDPFTSLSAPIPHKSLTLSVIFISRDIYLPPKEIVVKLPPDASLELLKASVATKTNSSMKNLRMFQVYKNKTCNFSPHNRQPISEIGNDDIIVICEIITFHEAKEQVVEINVIQRLMIPPLSARCSCKECGLKGVDLKRCTRCKSVAYCSRECQQKDWNRHKNKCKMNIRTRIGLPFIISLPITCLTYSNIVSNALELSKWSVEYDIAAGETGAAADLFELVPVDGEGNSIAGEGPLKDKGKDTLTITNKFIAVDWKNSSKNDDVKSKDLQVYRKGFHRAVGSEGSDVTLHDCLQLFTEPETLPKDNAWYCPNCKEHREATKRMSIWRLPPVLIINFKRFSYNNLMWRNKIDKFVKFPLKGLDMSPYLFGDAINQITSDSPPLYDLYGTVNHYGAEYLGHYTSLIKSPVTSSRGTAEWLVYDDDNVNVISRDDIVHKSAYILLYRRRDL